MLTGGPLLATEELSRLALRRRPAPAPDHAHVYLARSGRLYAPAGGLTPSELWRRAPRRVYDVDLAPHPLSVTVELTLPAGEPAGQPGGQPGEPAGAVSVELTGVWRTMSPVAVVTHQVVDVAAVARPQLFALLGAAVADRPWSGASELAALLAERPFPPVNLAEGICVFEIRATVLAA